jgi:ribonuclease Y
VIVNAIASHHEDVPQETAYAVLAQVGDAVSAARPGARADTADRYLKRLGDLERVATGFPGVVDAYAGRRAGGPGRGERQGRGGRRGGSPRPGHRKGRRGALTYPGEIKVTVVRRPAVSFAR